MNLDYYQNCFLKFINFHSSYNKHPYRGSAAVSNVRLGNQYDSSLLIIQLVTSKLYVPELCFTTAKAVGAIGYVWCPSINTPSIIASREYMFSIELH